MLRLEAGLGNEVSLVPLNVPTFSSVVISPDGTRLVYVGAIADKRPRLLTRRLDQPNVTELTGSEGAVNPFFSRDGRWVAFSIGKGLFKVPVDGGGAVQLGEPGVELGGDWDEDGNIVIATIGNAKNGVMRLTATGGAATPLLELAKGDMFHNLPQILPGGKAILIQTVPAPGQDKFAVEVVSIADRARKVLVRGVGSPRYLPSGHLVYTMKSTMFAVPFDLERMEVRGTAVAVLDDVAYDQIAETAQYGVSRTGTLVYRRHAGSSSTAQWLEATGKQEPLVARPGTYLGIPRVSPDGKRIAIAVQDGSNQDIWIYEPERDAMNRLTSGGGIFSGPLWTRDGRHIIYSVVGSGLRWTRADGAGQPQDLLAGIIQIPTAFSFDGTRLVYFVPDSNPQIWSVPIEAGSSGLKAGTPQRFLTTKYAILPAPSLLTAVGLPTCRMSLAKPRCMSGHDAERVSRRRTVADLQQRWMVAGMVAEQS